MKNTRKHSIAVVFGALGAWALSALVTLAFAGNTLSVGDSLRTGEFLTSANGIYQLMLQANGNLVLRDSRSNAPADNRLWRTYTGDEAADRLELMPNGNLVLWDGRGAKLWESDTRNSKADRLVLTNSGNLVLSRGDETLWSARDDASVNPKPDATGPDTGKPGVAKPNIVMILADDLPWYGTPVRMEQGNDASHNSLQRMPNLKQLAADGVVFSHAYATSSICGPSRANIQLGTSTLRSRYMANSGSGRGNEAPGHSGNAGQLLSEPNSLINLPAQSTTLAEKLGELQYKTAHFGKWHVWGDGPQRHGYHVSDGNTSNDEGNPDVIKDPRDPKRMFSITRSAIDFMKTQVSNGSPFYVQLSHYVAHKRYDALAQTRTYYKNLLAGPAGKNFRFKNDKERENTITQLAMMEDFDTSIGNLLQAIRALGIEDNTYIVFTADNGYDWKTPTNDLRGAKWWLFEAGIRVPLIIKGPGIRGGGQSTVNVSHYDFFPTFVDWAGSDSKKLAGIDGVSLKRHLESPASEPAFAGRNLYFHYPHYRNSTPQSVIINAQYKLLMSYDHLLASGAPRRGYFLFDLRGSSALAGEREAVNLFDRYPSVAYAMENEFIDYLESVSDDPYYLLPQVNPKARPGLQPVNIDQLHPPLARR